MVSLLYMALDHYDNIAPGRVVQRPTFPGPTETTPLQERKLAHQYARAFRQIGQQAIQAAHKPFSASTSYEFAHNDIKLVNYGRVLQQAKEAAIAKYGEHAYSNMMMYLATALSQKFGYRDFYDMQKAIDPRNSRKGRWVVRSICEPLLFFHEGNTKGVSPEKAYLQHSYLHNPAILARFRKAILQIPPKPGPLAKMQRFLHKVSPSGTMTSIIKWYEQATAFPS